VADNYIVPHNATTFTGNVLANDIGIHNASSPCVATTGSTGPQTVSAGAAGTLTLNPDGSFTLAVTAGFTNGATGSFTYCGNGNSALSATVTFYAAKVGGAPTANGDTYTSNVATLLHIAAPGVLLNDSDPNGYPLSAAPGVAGQWPARRSPRPPEAARSGWKPPANLPHKRQRPARRPHRPARSPITRSIRRARRAPRPPPSR